MNNAKIAAKREVFNSNGYYHPGIRYIMTEYNAKYIYSLLMRASGSVYTSVRRRRRASFGKQKSLPLIDPVLG